MALSLRYANGAGTQGTGDGLSEANAWSLDDVVTNWAAGLHIKYKGAGALTTTSTVFPVGPTASSPSIIEGYITTPGDLTTLGDVMSGASRLFDGGGLLDVTGWPSLQVGPDASIFARLTLSDYTILMGLRILSGSTTTGTILSVENSNVITTCTIEDVASSSPSGISNNADQATVDNCDFISNGSTAQGFLIGRGSATNCIFKGWDIGAQTSGLGDSVSGCVFWSCETGVSTLGRANYVNNNSFYDCTISILGPSVNTYHTNALRNISWGDNDAASYWYRDNTSPGGRWLDSNAVGNFQNEDDNPGDWVEYNRIAITADPFIDAANGDFGLNSDAAGGALCVGLGAIRPLTASSSSIIVIED